MIPSRTPLAHLALLALPSAYIAAEEMNVGDSYFSYKPELMAFWVGLFALVSLILHGTARWNRSLPDSSNATLAALASWSAAAAQGMTLALAFGGGVDANGIELGINVAAAVAAVIGLYYGIAWLTRRIKSGRTPQAPEASNTTGQAPEAVGAATRLDQALALAGTVAVFYLGVLAPDFVDDFFRWRPDVVHVFEGNAFVPVVPLVIRSLIEIAIPVALVLLFRERLLTHNAQKIVFAVSIAFVAATGTFGGTLSQGTPLIWMAATDAEELIGEELKIELRTMAERAPSRLCDYAQTHAPEPYSNTNPNYHFTYRGTPFAVFLSEENSTVRELASQMVCAK